MAKILLVEDTPETRELIEFALRREGHEVASFEDGESALESIVKGEYDVFIIDLALPKMSGFHVCLEIRKSPVNSNKPIIVSTGHGGLRDLFLLHEMAKIQDFIEKPYLPEELIKKINPLLTKVNK